ncbi:tesmin [Orycteropus afer afer]|uniref:Tesmin n=1 Tax=Orycteropus afer afer TaxID=1230840 RepID=A0A8B7A589_ORYAF|nr:tesmin [Orycteropus afer afer]
MVTFNEMDRHVAATLGSSVARTVELKEAGGPVPGNKPEEAASANPHAQEACCKLPSSQEPRDPSDCSRKDANPMLLQAARTGPQEGAAPGKAGIKALVASAEDMLSLSPSVCTPHLGATCAWPQASDYCSQKIFAGTRKVKSHRPARSQGTVGTGWAEKDHCDSCWAPSSVAKHGRRSPDPDSLPLQAPETTRFLCFTLGARYCDCFASGDFCNNCNCNNCCNNLRHEIERFRAIKACLDRNPDAFQPKIGRPGDVKPRHTKGCNCKRSGCLKNYCECYGAKIMCSSICKCIGCKNYEESPERKTLPSLASAAGTVGLEGGLPLAPSKASGASGPGADLSRLCRPFTCISWEVVEATCACLLAQGEEAEKEHCSEGLAEQRVLEEFGRCLSQILRTEFKSKGLKIE